MTKPSLLDIASKMGVRTHGFAAGLVGTVAATWAADKVSGAIDKAAGSAGAAIGNVSGDKIDAALARGSLIRFTQSSRVEPLVVVESEIADLDYTTDILQMVHTRFTGYYLLGVSMLTTVGGVKVLERLSQLNPNEGSLAGELVGLEQLQYSLPPGEADSFKRSLESNYWRASPTDYSWRLPTRANPEALHDRLTHVSAEAYRGKPTFKDVELVITRSRERTEKARIKAEQAKARAAQSQSKADVTAARADKDKEIARIKAEHQENIAKMKAKKDPVSTTFNLKTFDPLQQAANLSIGRLVQVRLENDGQSVEVPVSIRLMVTILRSSLVSEFFLTDNKMDKSFIERFYQWKAGSISFWKDLILCQDLIRQRRRKLVNDKSGVTKEIAKRESNAGINTTMSGKISLASRSNIFVISKDTVSEIYRRSGVNVENFKMRQKLFDQGMIMIMVVVDVDRNLVNVYEDSISLPTTYKPNELKTAGKGNQGGEIMDFLKSMQRPVGF